MVTLRPADGNETSGAYWVALNRRTGPSTLCLSRQNVPPLRGTSIEGVAKGAYILYETGSAVQAILLATGTEMSLAVRAAEGVLLDKGIAIRLVSMPSWELFRCQGEEYRRSVLLLNNGTQPIPIVSVEALSTVGWSEWSHVAIGMTSFGASGPYKQVYEKFGFTAECIAERVEQTIQFYKKHPLPDLCSRP
jgi:transketolase